MGLKPRKSSKQYTVEPDVEFLNVDLELESPLDLEPLVSALGPVFILHSTSEPPFVAHLEIEHDVDRDFNDTIRALLVLIETLDDAGQAMWNECTVRRFDIGLQSGLQPHSSQYTLPATLLQRLAAIDAEVVITLYGARYEAQT